MLLALIIVAMFALAILELWLFWMLGEHQDRRRPRSAVGRPPHTPRRPIYRQSRARMSPPDTRAPNDDAGTRALDPPDHPSRQSSAPTASPACN